MEDPPTLLTGLFTCLNSTPPLPTTPLPISLLPNATLHITLPTTPLLIPITTISSTPETLTVTSPSHSITIHTASSTPLWHVIAGYVVAVEKRHQHVLADLDDMRRVCVALREGIAELVERPQTNLKVELQKTVTKQTLSQSLLRKPGTLSTSQLFKPPSSSISGSSCKLPAPSKSTPELTSPTRLARPVSVTRLRPPSSQKDLEMSLPRPTPSPTRVVGGKLPTPSRISTPSTKLPSPKRLVTS